jgi:hypothetical protein
MPRSS